MLFLFLSVCALFCVYTWWWLRNRHILRLTSCVPTLPGSLPLLGNSYQLIGNTTYVWKRMAEWWTQINEMGGVAKIWLGPFFLIGVTDADIALQVANSCLRKHDFYSFFITLGDGLLTADGEKWKKHRKLLSPAFNQHVINDYLNIFNQQSALLVQSLRKNAGKGEFDPSALATECSLEAICQTAIGLPEDQKKVVNESFASALDKVTGIMVKRLSRPWLYPNFIYNLTAIRKEAADAANIMKDMVAKVVKNSNFLKSSAKPYSQLHTSKRKKPFLELLLELGNKGHLTEAEIKDEVNTMIVTGYDTTSAAIVFLLVMLGSYPEVQEMAYQEVKKVFRETSTSITKEELSELVYLEAVIKETLRVYPLGPVIIRQADKDVKFDGFTIPAGCGIAVSIWGMHRCKKYWGEDAEDFKPERWLDPSTLPDHPGAFAGFSLGRRNCIGKTYAMTSLKTTLAHVLRKYRIKADHTRLELKFEILLKPETGHCISIEMR